MQVQQLMEAAMLKPTLGFSPGAMKAIRTHRRIPSLRMASKSLRPCGAACSIKLGFQNAKVGQKAFEFKCSAAETKGGKEVGDLLRKNLAVFVSGGGSNFRSIHEATLRGSVHGDVVVLVTDKLVSVSPYRGATFCIVILSSATKMVSP